jgi:Na+/H+ antiporter NhaD/arsenite permease-like protein
MIPFLLYLLLIALLPLASPRLWTRNRNKLLLALAFAAPVVASLLARAGGTEALARTALEYLSFITLLAALFAISGGILLRGALAGTPLANTTLLTAGALLANVIGTMGASALLVRPLVRANASRPHNAHVFVFFIFIVANGAGMLTPLGDPPLFLGFLRGVPFGWTLRLVAPWALVNGFLLVAFNLIDRRFWRRHHLSVAIPAAPEPGAGSVVEGLRIDGLSNIWCLLALVALSFALGTWGPELLPDWRVRSAAQVLGMAALAAISLITTPGRIHRENHFEWAPVLEVAVIFLGIFITMVPALAYLEQRGADLGITEPWQFFWAAGALSSFLDNAPTYLTFTSLATGVVNSGADPLATAASLGGLASHLRGERLLAAISCGSVFMGAVTYIGNGPNFMVKAIAEQHRIKMPSFFGYMAWSLPLLMPVFALACWLFFGS